MVWFFLKNSVLLSVQKSLSMTQHPSESKLFWCTDMVFPSSNEQHESVSISVENQCLYTIILNDDH